MLQLASRGQHTSVDMLVKDIYGGSYGSLGLTGDLIASSFGKSATADKGDAWPHRFVCDHKCIQVDATCC